MGVEMDAIDAFLRGSAEPLQYAIFFGALVALGALETVVGRSPAAPRRRRRWLPNFGLTVLNILVLGAIPLSGVLVADLARDGGIGLLNLMALPAVVAVAAGILIRSLISWATHLAMHRIPVLWRVHRVHHTDSFLDVSTTVRFHPVEFLIATPVLLAGVLVTGIPPVALMAYELLDTAMAVFTHANLRLPPTVERGLRLVMVTPDMHRIHHSASQPETDSNYGATFSIWDRLFGTYREMAPQNLADLRLGLDGVSEDRASSLWWMLTLPVRGRTTPEP